MFLYLESFSKFTQKYVIFDYKQRNCLDFVTKKIMRVFLAIFDLSKGGAEPPARPENSGKKGRTNRTFRER